MQAESNLVELPVIARCHTLADALLRVQPRATIHTAGKGKILIQEDDYADHAIVLLEGWIAHSKMLPDGETQIIDVMLPGDFALIGAVDVPVAACSVEALSDVRFINMRPEQANGAQPGMSRLREMMAGEIVRTQARTSELLLRLGKGSAASRVAYALLEFHVRLEAIGLTNDNRFAFPMTQQKIGECTGLSNVHVCRTMRRFERDAIISHPDKSDIILHDCNALCKIAGIDLKTLRHKILLHQAI